jgi:probable selenium-dependent hydroxylase accessory protein YqeC
LTEYPKIDVVETKKTVSRKAASLREAFDIQDGEVISLVGGGGKTALMLALAGELVAAGKSVITTTTTKIYDWQTSGTSLIVEKDENRMLELLVRALEKHRHITLARERLADEGKMKGISPGLVDELTKLKRINCIIVEADGAARKPLKAPNDTEPVIPQNTSLVIPVVGIDALGSELNEDNVFRPQIVSRLTGLPRGGNISAEAIAVLLTRPDGIIKGSPARARIIPLINKMDLETGLARAEDLAARILGKGHPRIDRIVLGQVQCLEPVVRVMSTARNKTFLSYKQEGQHEG